MAVIYSTTFEDYSLATTPTDLGMTSKGWTDNSSSVEVKTTKPHTGTKSCFIDLNSIWRNVGYAGRSVTVEAWFYYDTVIHANNLGPSIGLGLASTSVFNLTVLTPIDSTNLTLTRDDVADQTVTNVLTANAWQKLTLRVKFSTVNGTNTDVLADGCVTVLVNDVAVITQTATRVFVDDADWATGANRWDSVIFSSSGYIDDIYVRSDEVTCGQKVGSFVFGVNTDVKATRAIAFGLDGNTNVHNTAGMFKVFGDVDITGNLSAASMTGGGSGAPTTAQYVTLATDAGLTNERVLTAGTGITLTDAGAGSTVTIAASGGASFATAVKTADTSRNSTTTPTDDPHLTFAVGANQTWWWEAFIRYVCTSTTPDLKVGISVPGDATAEWGCVVDDLGPGRFAAWNTGIAAGALLSKTGTQAIGTPGSANASGLYIAGWVFTNTNTGALALQWAQNTSNATNVTWKIASFVRYVQLL